MDRSIRPLDVPLLTAASSNSAAFWKAYRSMANPKSRAPAVSLADLASCFEKRMNAPDPAPPAFNMERMRVVEESAANIPLPSEESSHPTLKGT
jgi:hypothetical protein